MSARQHRRKRWEQPSNRRPGQRAMASRAHGKQYSSQELTEAIDVSMRAGESMGRKWGERDLYLELSHLLDDPDELHARIAGRALAERADMFLLVESAYRENPEAMDRLADIVEDETLTDDERSAALRELSSSLGPPTSDAEPDNVATEPQGWIPTDDPREGPDGCRPWCVADHTTPDPDQVWGFRECAGEAEQIRSLTGVKHSPRAVQTYDQEDGKWYAPEVRIGDDTFDAANARKFAAAILNAADQVDQIAEQGNVDQ